MQGKGILDRGNISCGNTEARASLVGGILRSWEGLNCEVVRE